MIKKFTQWFATLLAIALLAAVILYARQAMEAQANRPAPVKQVEVRIPDVSVLLATAGRQRATVTAYADAEPHYALTLTAQVAGRVEYLAPAFETGQRLAKGVLMARLDDTEHRAAVAAAEQDVEDARLALLEEQRTALQARNEWTASGIAGEPDSELVLRTPQLAAAQAALDNAEASLENARHDLARTRITAPFDALVVERGVTPGSYLQAGTTVATLYSTDRVEVSAALSASEWDKLSQEEDMETTRASLLDVRGKGTWSARILRQEKHFDTTTRQRNLVLAVDQPFDAEPPLLPGTFVQAHIPGGWLENVWKLPNEALSQSGEIWYVREDGTLDRFQARVLFSSGDDICVAVPEALRPGTQKVLRHPLTDYMPGMRVNAVEVHDNA